MSTRSNSGVGVQSTQRAKEGSGLEFWVGEYPD